MSKCPGLQSYHALGLVCLMCYTGILDLKDNITSGYGELRRCLVNGDPINLYTVRLYTTHTILSNVFGWLSRCKVCMQPFIASKC